MIGGKRAIANVQARLAALPPEATAMDRVCAAFGAHVETVLTESTYVVAAIRTMGQLPPDIRERQLQHQRMQAQLWRELINDAREAGEMDPELDPRSARMFLLGAANWAPEWWHPERGSIEDTVRMAERLVRNALSARSAPKPEPGEKAAEPAAGKHPSLAPVFAPPAGRP
jgi:hypothetical protein